MTGNICNIVFHINYIDEKFKEKFCFMLKQLRDNVVKIYRRDPVCDTMGNQSAFPFLMKFI